MFKVIKNSPKKIRFITKHDSSNRPKIKFIINQIKKEPLKQDKSIISSHKTSQLKQKSSNSKKLFSILHKQIQIQPITPISHIKKKKIVINVENKKGRWTIEEHKKFIEGIIKFGNNWKKIQKYISTRTATQARSHAQKFFDKIKKNNIFKKLFLFSENDTNNFTHINIEKLHDKYHNCSQEKINSIVNEFLNVEYDLSKNNKRNLMGNNLLSFLKKKKKICRNKIIISEDINNNEINKTHENNDKNFISILIDDGHPLEKKNNNEVFIKKNMQINLNDDNNQNNLISNLLNKNNSYCKTINNNCNNFNNCSLDINNKYLSNFPIYNQFDLDYILNQFINNLSQDNLSYNSCRFNLGKNAAEPVGEGSVFIKNNNLNNQEQQNKTKSRENTIDLNSIYNQKNDSDLNNFFDYQKNT